MLGTKILEERESKYNGHVRVLRTLGMGIYIQCNGLTQSGGVVEQIWRSTLKRITNHESQITDILILGLGGGTVAKLLRKKYPNAKITGVEIDPIMIELGTRHLGLDTKDIKVVIADASDYCLLPNAHDLIIVDTYLGDKFVDIAGFHPASKVTIFNRLYYDDKKKEALKFGEKLKKIYIKVDTFYPTANVMFFCYNS